MTPRMKQANASKVSHRRPLSFPTPERIAPVANRAIAASRSRSAPIARG